MTKETEGFKKEDETRTQGEGLSNSKERDSSSKLIFGDNILCAQFLRGYTGIPQLQNVQPEDIEDVSERYVHMFTEERNSDVVKKIRIGNDEIPFYLVSLIEHKSEIDYNVVMQIFRYMAFIWEDYEKEENKRKEGISKTKGFKYPPILPLIFYDGVSDWTAALSLKERIYLSDIFSEYIPDYKCMLVQIQNYSNQEIMEKKGEFSILMLINKLHEVAEFRTMEKEIPSEYLEEVTKNTPEYLLKIMGEVISVLLSRLKLSQEEVEEFTGQIREKKMGELFTHFKGYDVPAMRIKLREEMRDEVVEEVRQEVRQEDLKIFIETLNELKLSKETVIEKLIDKYSLVREEAEEKISLYW